MKIENIRGWKGKRPGNGRRAGGVVRGLQFSNALTDLVRSNSAFIHWDSELLKARNRQQHRIAFAQKAIADVCGDAVCWGNDQWFPEIDDRPSVSVVHQYRSIPAEFDHLNEVLDSSPSHFSCFVI
jgi:hypothetical protein